MVKKPNLYQIFYSDDTEALTDKAFPALDNRDSPHPDWFEYWPIRRFLLEQDLMKTELYGFFSPRFREKTGLDLHSVSEFINEDEARSDAYIFSPQPDMGAFFLNVFEQEETFNPGFTAGCQHALRYCGIEVSLKSLVMDSRSIVFSNYIVATGDFWLQWLNICEGIYKLANDEAHACYSFLNRPTRYPKSAQIKVFLIERIAPLMLTLNKSWTRKAANPFRFSWSMSRLRENPVKSYISDSLKIAYNELGYPEYLGAFSTIRNEFIQEASKNDTDR